jgi:outer membrane protein OmpA-like peptidoglycan-associated protein
LRAAATAEVIGHADSTGELVHNQTLSERRAAAVRSWLENKDLSLRGRLTSKGLGETAPVAPNNTAAGRQRNRRVEVVF